MSIDWEKFSARVPLCIQVRWDFLGRENHGILLQTVPFQEFEESSDPETTSVYDENNQRYAEHLRVQSLSGTRQTHHSLNKDVEDLDYLINDVWQTFDQIMKD